MFDHHLIYQKAVFVLSIDGQTPQNGSLSPILVFPERGGNNDYDSGNTKIESKPILVSVKPKLVTMDVIDYDSSNTNLESKSILTPTFVKSKLETMDIIGNIKLESSDLVAMDNIDNTNIESKSKLPNSCNSTLLHNIENSSVQRVSQKSDSKRKNPSEIPSGNILTSQNLINNIISSVLQNYKKRKKYHVC